MKSQNINGDTRKPFLRTGEEVIEIIDTGDLAEIYSVPIPLYSNEADAYLQIRTSKVPNNEIKSF